MGSVQRRAKKRFSGGVGRQMKKKIFDRTGKAVALLMAAIMALSGCDYSLSGKENSGIVQADESAAESAKKQEKTGKQNVGEPAVLELYDVMTVPYMRLQAYGDNAYAALALGEEKIKSLDALLSTGNPESEIGKLNASGFERLGDDASFLLKTSLDIYRQTDGAFDVSVFPLMELWGFTNLFDTSLEEAIEEAEQKVKEKAEKGGSGSGKESEPASEETREAPSEADIQEVLKKVDCSKIVFHEETGEVTLPDGMKIDFGGIAKGYASQSVAEILRENGITSAIMDLGGNIQAVGRKPNGSKWRIALNDRNKGGFLGILTVEDCAVITSGGYERNFRDAEGNIYHHIIDPKTGHPADNGFSVDASVTIICENGTMADALSTAMYVCGPQKAMDYWRAHRDEFQMIMMTDENKMYVTEGIADDYQSDYKFEVIH